MYEISNAIILEGVELKEVEKDPYINQTLVI